MPRRKAADEIDRECKECKKTKEIAEFKELGENSGRRRRTCMKCDAITKRPTKPKSVSNREYHAKTKTGKAKSASKSASKSKSRSKSKSNSKDDKKRTRATSKSKSASKSASKSKSRSKSKSNSKDKKPAQKAKSQTKSKSPKPKWTRTSRSQSRESEKERNQRRLPPRQIFQRGGTIETDRADDAAVNSYKPSPAPMSERDERSIIAGITDKMTATVAEQVSQRSQIVNDMVSGRLKEIERTLSDKMPGIIDDVVTRRLRDEMKAITNANHEIMRHLKELESRQRVRDERNKRDVRDRNRRASRSEQSSHLLSTEAYAGTETAGTESDGSQDETEDDRQKRLPQPKEADASNKYDMIGGGCTTVPEHITRVITLGSDFAAPTTELVTTDIAMTETCAREVPQVKPDHLMFGASATGKRYKIYPHGTRKPHPKPKGCCKFAEYFDAKMNGADTYEPVDLLKIQHWYQICPTCVQGVRVAAAYQDGSLQVDDPVHQSGLERMVRIYNKYPNRTITDVLESVLIKTDWEANNARNRQST